MKFLTENKDLLALIVSLAALAISTYLSYRNLKTTRESATQNLRTSKEIAAQNLAVTREIASQNLATTREIAEAAAEHNRTLAQSATYQRIHELLVDPKAAAGRRRLFQAEKAGCYPAIGENSWDEINYSLALYDTLGGYMNRDQVDGTVVLDAWHHPLANIAKPVREFVAHRRQQGVNQPWAHLMDLLSKAEAYECRCPQVNGSQ
jgi:hypothetical protein